MNAPNNLHGKLLAGRPVSNFFLQWKNAGPSAFSIQKTMLEIDKV